MASAWQSCTVALVLKSLLIIAMLVSMEGRANSQVPGWDDCPGPQERYGLSAVNMVVSSSMGSPESRCPGAQENPALSESFYENSCPGAPELISELINEEVARDPTLPAAFVRLLFHDCFVRGCDASVLVNTTAGDLAEQSAVPNANSLRGFDVIERVKSAVEEKCPGIVSCADILASSARDSLVALSGPDAGYRVPLGRRDGTVSLADEVNATSPDSSMNYSQLVQNFALQGLTARDMVILSGSHSIGIAHCSGVLARIYDFRGVPGAVDPSLDPAFVTQLRAQCPRGQPGSYISMNPWIANISASGQRDNQTFSSQYFKNLLENRGNFQSDSTLISTPEGLAVVEQLAANLTVPFFHDFGCAMEKMGRIKVLTGTQGEIREVCAYEKNPQR